MKLTEMCPADFLAGLRATEGLVGTPTDAYALRIFRQELRRRLDVAYEAEHGKATVEDSSIEPLAWSNELPTEEGFYWCQLPYGGKPMKGEVRKGAGGKLFITWTHGSTPFCISWLGPSARWCGPVEPPPEPSTEPDERDMMGGEESVIPGQLEREVLTHEIQIVDLEERVASLERLDKVSHETHKRSEGHVAGLEDHVAGLGDRVETLESRVLVLQTLEGLADVRKSDERTLEKRVEALEELTGQNPTSKESMIPTKWKKQTPERVLREAQDLFANITGEPA